MNSKGLKNQRQIDLQHQPYIRDFLFELLKRGALIGFLLFLCFLVIQTCFMSGPKSLSIDTEHLDPEAPISLISTNIQASDVDSCIWYVGDQEVSHTKTLTNYTPSKKDLEHFVRVSVTLKDGTYYEDSIYLSTLPVLYLESDIAYSDVTKEENATVSMKLSAGNEYTSSELYSGSAEIHLRGNSTSVFPKHPLKLKLAKKVNLLNLGESKHWVLLANAIDSSLMRNKLVYGFSGEIGAPCQMNSEFISLIYNGEYQGVYQLCEHVRIGENSVNVFNWEDVAKDAAERLSFELLSQRQISQGEQPKIQEQIQQDLCSDLSWLESGLFESSSLKLFNEQEGRKLPTSYDLRHILDFDSLPDPTGGVLLEMNYFRQADACLETNYFLPFYFNRPMNGVTYPALHSYIHEYLQVVEYAFHDTDFTYHNDSPHYRMDEIGEFDWGDAFAWVGITFLPVDFYSSSLNDVHYSEVIDFNSLMVNFLLCEFTVNWDGMKNSVFLYKDIEGPFYLAPAWDYDSAWGNSCNGIPTWNPEVWQTTDPFFSNDQYYQTVQWNRYLIRDPYFLACIYEKYWEIREPMLEAFICEGGLIDQYAQKLKPAADANDARWDGCDGTYKGQKFEEGIETMKEFIQLRLAWLDQQFSSIESLRRSLGYYITSDTLQIEPANTTFQKGMSVITVHTTCPDYAGISFQVNGTLFYQATISDGTAVLLIPNCALQHEYGTLNTIQVRALDDNGSYITNTEGTIPGDYINGISNYISF